MDGRDAYEWRMRLLAGGAQNLGVKGVIAGAITGGIEAVVTFPTEFIKTQLQLDNKGADKQYSGTADVFRKTVDKHGYLGLYRGMAILIYGSVPKAATRFGTFEMLKSLIADENGRLTRAQSFGAGLCAGCTESVCAVTPMETIKVKMINDRRLPEPRYKNMFHGVALIVKEEGLRGIYKGLVPTTLKQASNQAIRFTIMDALKDWYRGDDLTKEVPLYMIPPFALVGGTISVFANTPVDVMKTKMQGLDGHKYKGTWDCIVQMYSADGLVGFYRGLVPRMMRVSLEVTVTFTVYDAIMKLINVMWP